MLAGFGAAWDMETVLHGCVVQRSDLCRASILLLLVRFAADRISAPAGHENGSNRCIQATIAFREI
jgi:hypothetical protein